MKRKPSYCPECGPASVARVVYGLPDGTLRWDRLERLMAAGRVYHAGEAIVRPLAAWHCPSCEHEWGQPVRVSGSVYLALWCMGR